MVPTDRVPPGRVLTSGFLYLLIVYLMTEYLLTGCLGFQNNYDLLTVGIRLITRHHVEYN